MATYGIVFVRVAIQLTILIAGRLSRLAAVKIVAETLSVGDVCGIRTEFFAQSGDIHIHRAVADNDIAPNGFHQLLTRENLSAIRQ